MSKKYCKNCHAITNHTRDLDCSKCGSTHEDTIEEEKDTELDLAWKDSDFEERYSKREHKTHSLRGW